MPAINLLECDQTPRVHASNTLDCWGSCVHRRITDKGEEEEVDRQWGSDAFDARSSDLKAGGRDSVVVVGRMTRTQALGRQDVMHFHLP